MRGPKYTTVSFRGIKQQFPTSKDAYVWLVEKFMGAKPDLLESHWQRQFAAKGRVRNYFSRNKKEMFLAAPELADDENNFTRLGNGWYAILNLSNAEKVRILGKLAVIANLQHKQDWDWVDGTKRPPPPSPVPVSAL